MVWAQKQLESSEQLGLNCVTSAFSTKIQRPIQSCWQWPNRGSRTVLGIQKNQMMTVVQQAHCTGSHQHYALFKYVELLVSIAQGSMNEKHTLCGSSEDAKEEGYFDHDRARRKIRLVYDWKDREWGTKDMPKYTGSLWTMSTWMVLNFLMGMFTVTVINRQVRHEN